MIESEERIVKKPQIPNSPNIKLHTNNLSRTMIILVFTSLLLITGYTLTHLDTANVQIGSAFKELSTTLHQMFLQPNTGTDGFIELLQGLGMSLLISVMTTIIGAIFGFFFAVLASKNLTNIYL